MKNKLIKIKTLVLACMLIIGCLVMGCESNDEESGILLVLDGAVHSLEQGNAKAVIKSTTKDFVVYPGKMNKWSSLKQIHALLRSYGAFSILHPTPEIQIDDSDVAALASVPFVTVTSDKSWAELKALENDADDWVAYAEKYGEVHRLELSMVKKDGHWLAETARFF
ncbi:MAG: hypothetical protein GY847_05920 [Proteobacteria bacterium]|nr:hypothetical protein [Pseudomonadota bacterium]